MNLPRGLERDVYIDRLVAAAGGPGWVVRWGEYRFSAHGVHVIPREGDTMDFLGGLGDKMLTPEGPAFWCRLDSELELI